MDFYTYIFVRYHPFVGCRFCSNGKAGHHSGCKVYERIRQKLEYDATEWTWKVYLLLAKALCHTKGYYTKEALDAYLTCIEYRKKYDEYGKKDIKLDIDLSHEISEIYRVKKEYVASNKWFREEMLLRDAGCDIVIKNKINDLSAKAAMLADESHTEDALRLYEELAHLIEKNISAECDRYAMVQLQMGSLFMNGYTIPRYDLAVECFQKFVEIKRKYMQDLSEELSDSFSRILPEMQKLCRKSIDDIVKLFRTFMRARGSLDGQDPNLVELRDAVGNGWCNVKVKIQGLKEECNWKMTQ